MAIKPELVFWGLVASPYQLKMQALADYSGVAAVA